MGTTGVVGRVDELARITSLLQPQPVERGLVITGDHGIGKTALCGAATDQIRATGTHELLQCAPAEAERHLAYSGLSDLLAAVDPAVLDGLPPPQRHAMAVATLTADPTPTAPDERAVAYGFLGVVRALAAVRPVVIAVDDLQWLDAPTALALSYVARRCAAEAVVFLLSGVGIGGVQPHPVVAALGRRAWSELVLGPLGLGSLHRLTRSCFGVDLARPQLLHLHATSGGNPQRALEIMGCTAAAGRPGTPEYGPADVDARSRDSAAFDADIAAGGERAGFAHAQLALLLLSTRADVTVAREHARNAVDLLGDACPIEVLTGLAVLENFAGPTTTARLDQAVALSRTSRVDSIYEHPVFWAGHRLMLEDRFDEARTEFLTALAMAAPGGDEWAQAAMLVHVAELECRAGNWNAAAAHARRCSLLTRDAAHGQPGLARYAEAMVAVRQGDLVRARSLAAEGRQLAEAGGDELYRIQNTGVLAHAAVALGEWAEAARLLREMPDHLIALGWREPTVFPLWPDAIESLMAVGEPDLATRYHGIYAANADAYARPTAQATAARCAGLLQASRGDLPGALDTMSAAARLHQRSPDRYESGRTLLALGAIRRRARMKRAAREALDDALAIFEELGSPVWAERVRAEIARIGGRVATTELTDAEERVAALAARGARNRAIAAELFLTENTVEVHLSRIYRKLAVRSRAELAHRFPAGKR
ncbi:AAA family ATPase [Micromonospora olivasterospora]|uniref:Regulatory LuxR family protein n=1 Tax=Micromonospora olivasterospora TaxID=1880 RepID=A0A562IIZ7_MICOL|nr:LuxR family transcriptional regulator [Micromonospora olivasterospora]TWH70872.1 regulatory LuxR family protein [Micromonospora olivasterospora]